MMQSKTNKMNTSPISFTFADEQQSPHRRSTSRTRSRPVPSNSPPRRQSSLASGSPPPRPTQTPVRETMLTRLGAASSSDQSDSQNESLNIAQQIAMDEFLAAQTSGDAMAKEEKWRELVRLMKEPQLRRSRSRSSRGSTSSYSNEKVLGFIRFGGSVGDDSIASGLTSPTSSPRTSNSPLDRRRDGSVERSYGDDNTLPTFPSLPGHESLETLPTFPSLPGRHVSDSEDDIYRFTQWRGIEEEDHGGVFEDANADNINNISKESSTWDSLLLSSNDHDDSGLNTTISTDSLNTNSIVKNLVGRYETSINKSLSQNSSFFQRTNPTNKEAPPTPLKSRVVSSSPVAATPQKEMDASATTHRSRRSRRENSLEEQVRYVLKKQQSHTVEVADESNMPRSPSVASLPLNKPDILSRRIKSESVASAQDILAELRRSPTPPGSAKLPRSISVGATPKSPLNSPGREGPKSSPLALAPSRRDLPRPNRGSRKSVSESNAFPVSATSSPTGNASLNEAPSKISSAPATASQSAKKAKATTEGTHTSISSPLTIGSEGSSKNNAASIKSNETPVANKPLVGLPPSKKDVPTVSSTRRLLPSVRGIAARFNSQMKNASSESFPASSPNADRSITSGGSRDRIDEIRASITKLKHNGVGGIGKATSTLVRNQETGRYIIRDVDDTQFDDIMLAEMMRPTIDVNELSRQEHQSVSQGAHQDGSPVDVNTVFRMNSEGSTTSSILSDGVVDDAVRAAIDAISSTSTENDFVEPSGSGSKEDDFFVLKSTTQWSSFQSNAQSSLAEDAFDIDPVDDWDDSGSDEWRDKKYSLAAMTQSNAKNNLRSPTSVILGPNRKITRNEKPRNQDVEPWNPFDV